MPLPLTQNANSITYATSVDAALASIYLYNPSYALYQDPEAPEKQVRDLVISGSLDHLHRSIVGHSWHFEPKTNDKSGRALANILEELTKEQRGFSQSLYNLARASHRGCTWGRIFSEKRVLKIGDGKEREWTVITKVRDVDNRRFRLTQNFGANNADLTRGNPSSSELARRVEETPGMNSPLPMSPAGYNTENLGAWRWEMDRGYVGGGGRGGSTWFQPIEQSAPFDHWILHVVDTTEWGCAYGWGLQDELQSYFWLKGTFLRWAAQAAERFGQGFLVVKTKALRDGMAKGMSQAASLQQTVNVIRTWRSNNFAAVDELSDIQMVDMAGEGMKWLWEWVKYFDNAMRQRILAALQPTGSSEGGGGYSSGKVEEESTDSMVAYLRTPLEETWTHTGVHFLVQHNEQNLRELGLWGIGDPRLRLMGKEQRDGELMLKWFDLAARLKIPVKKSDFYEASGLSAPNEEDGDDDLIEYPDLAVDDPNAPFDPQPDGRDAAPIGEGGQAVGDRKGQLNGAAA